MEYTGDVYPGGPAAIRELETLTITKFSVSMMDNNVYLLRCRATGQQLLIDAADEPERIMEFVGDAGLSTVVTTHRHWDHIRATAAIVERTGAASLAHPADAGDVPAVTGTVDDGGTISCGDVTIEAIHLAGHTPGGLALLYRDPGGHPHLFTGDSLFPGGVGKTQTAADFDSLYTDVETKVFGRLPDDTWVYPGHGDDTTLGAERPKLPEWRARGW
ncbi:MBL fold metallo-hydrolase [Stackebrandtia nassauensis]|uniref:Beta-lactamase domain protein n=1 Tax=Stackebrandtia nassauensis (strain DSM 44728 / CIP 108903 / NRRL B-16338 / NBRC 102104 / LLR-40K-21) TaxID=446470 RepID=D3QAM2_STANL|nr:MBL fold metallo-hydrolase [Stackebrandtia nassauensis]ADD42805.1 beta-lactamase domain protein [Stackebrandtia nassauensis DSM 44728]